MGAASTVPSRVWFKSAEATSTHSCRRDAAMALSKPLQDARVLSNMQAGGLAKAYLPSDARAKVFHGLWPGSDMTEAALADVLKCLDQFLVVDDYGSVECVKFAREEYNKRPGGRVAGWRLPLSQ